MNINLETSAQTSPLTLPKSALLTESEMALFVDYYQLTMGQTDFNSQNDAVITSNYYVRKIPQGEYLIAAGLEQVIHFILNLRFTDTTLNWLAQRGELTKDYLESLKDFRFEGSIYAVPEGTLVFPNEPIINVIGRSRDVQLFETYLLCVMNFQTLIATKASRIVRRQEANQFLISVQDAHTVEMQVSSLRVHHSSVVPAGRPSYLQDVFSISPTSARWHINLS